MNQCFITISRGHQNLVRLNLIAIRLHYNILLDNLCRETISDRSLLRIDGEWNRGWPTKGGLSVIRDQQNHERDPVWIWSSIHNTGFELLICFNVSVVLFLTTSFAFWKVWLQAFCPKNLNKDQCCNTLSHYNSKHINISKCFAPNRLFLMKRHQLWNCCNSCGISRQICDL